VVFRPALGYRAWLSGQGAMVLGATMWWRDLLLVAAGVVTAVPLLFFGAAATRVPLTTLGLVQYATPTIQLMIGVLLYREPMPPARLAGFAIVWLALAVFTVDSLGARRRRLVAERAAAVPV
jgi:chloramphenicol-sensitive protein RarD